MIGQLVQENINKVHLKSWKYNHKEPLPLPLLVRPYFACASPHHSESGKLSAAVLGRLVPKYHLQVGWAKLYGLWLLLLFCHRSCRYVSKTQFGESVFCIVALRKPLYTLSPSKCLWSTMDFIGICFLDLYQFCKFCEHQAYVPAYSNLIIFQLFCQLPTRLHRISTHMKLSCWTFVKFVNFQKCQTLTSKF